MLRQAKEGLLPTFASTWVFRLWGSWVSLQHCLASKALMKQVKSWKPIPPWAFECPIFSQLIWWIFFSFSLWPHQTFCIRELISMQKVFGSKNMLMLYGGMAWTIAFISISFLACDRNFVFQSGNHWLCFSLYPLLIGILVYETFPPRLEGPNICHTAA